MAFVGCAAGSPLRLCCGSRSLKRDGRRRSGVIGGSHPVIGRISLPISWIPRAPFARIGQMGAEKIERTHTPHQIITQTNDRT